MTGPRSSRQLHSSARSIELRELLQSLFVGELVLPSRCLWLVSPWISDIPTIDNGANSFTQLAPDWERGQIALSKVIARLLDSGTTVHIATRDDEHNRSFLSALRSLDREALLIHTSDELHEKGLLCDHFYISGSMNFTLAGIQLNQEVAHLITDPADIAHHKVTFTHRWGGERK